MSRKPSASRPPSAARARRMLAWAAVMVIFSALCVAVFRTGSARAAAPAAAAASLPQYTILDLGPINPGQSDQSQGYGLNDNGLVYGESYNGGYRGALWDSGGVHDMGSLGGGSSYAGQLRQDLQLGGGPAINATGQVVGRSLDAKSHYHAFLFDLSAGLFNLGALTTAADGSSFSDAAAVNATSYVVGRSYIYTPSSGVQFHAFLWTPTRDGTGNLTFHPDGSYGTMTDLGTLTPNPASPFNGFDGQSEAYGVNAARTVVGYASTPSGSHAFLDDGAMHDLGTLYPNPSTAGSYFGSSVAYDINDSGQVVGQSYTATGYTQAFLHTGTGPLQAADSLGSLSTTVNRSSSPTALSANGFVTGYSYAPGVNTGRFDYTTSGSQHAFLWDAANGMRDLGSLAVYDYLAHGSGQSGAFDSQSVAHAVNTGGVVVGESLAVDGNRRAFVWLPSGGGGQMYDLNHLLAPGTGVANWTLQTATGVNAAGQITGTGTLSGATHAFLLTPAPAAAAPDPSVAEVDAQSVLMGSPAFTLSVTGAGYRPGALVHFNHEGAAGDLTLATRVQSDSLLYADVPASALTTSGKVDVTVTDPGDPTASNAAVFTIYDPNPKPTITKMTPDRTPVYTAGDVTIDVFGTNFVSDASHPHSKVYFEGTFYTPTFDAADPTHHLTFTVPAADNHYSYSHPIQVFVRNPPPTNDYPNQDSVPATFYVTGLVPTIDHFTPDHLTAGSADDVDLQIIGTNFDPSTRILVNGQDSTNNYFASFKSRTNVQVRIFHTSFTAAGTIAITVTNPAQLPKTDAQYPDGGSAEKDLPVNPGPNPVPTVTDLGQHDTPAGSGDTNINVFGTGFVATSTVKLEDKATGTLLDTLTPYTVYSSTQLGVKLPQKDLTTPQAYTVVVSSPASAQGGGGDSAANPPKSTFTVGNVRPTLDKMDPATALAGGPAFKLALTGTGFIAGATVLFSGDTLTPDPATLSSTHLDVTVPAKDIATVRAFYVQVVNPAFGGAPAYSSTIQYPQDYFAVNNPVPTLLSISPNAGVKNTDTAITATGTNFKAAYGTFLIFNGSGFTPTAIVDNGDGTQSFTVTVPGAYLSTLGTVDVWVRNNEGSGSGDSAHLPFTVQAAPNPVPTVTNLSDHAKQVGSPGFYLTVFGTGFVASSVIKFNGIARTDTTLVSDSQVQTRLSNAELQTAQAYTVTVFNPAPGGGPSTSPTPQVLTVGNPVPVVSGLTPSGVAAGTTGFTLTVNGSGFVAGSTVNFGADKNLPIVAASYAPTAVQVKIPDADLATAGTAGVTVSSPAPGGGTSGPATFTIQTGPNPTPAITGLSPSSALAGGGDFTLAVSGSGFVPGLTTVSFDGVGLTPTFDAADPTHLLTVPVTAALIAAPHTATVTVATPASTGGGGGTATASFAVNAKAVVPPTLSSATAVSASEIDLAWVAGVQPASRAKPAAAKGGKAPPAPAVKLQAGTAVTYSVKRATTAGGPYVTVKTGLTATTFSDTGLPAATKFFYVVTETISGSESPNSNEKSATTFSLTAGAPNLAPTGLTFPNTAGGTESLAVTWTAQDSGNGDAKGSWSDTLYLSKTGTLDATAVPLGTFAAPSPVAAGKAYTRVQTVQLPREPAGSYFLIVNVDAGRSILETTYDDNTLAMPLQIVHTQSLVVSPGQSALSLTPGAPGQGQLTLTNLGPDTLTGIGLSVQGAAPNITVTMTVPDSLAPGASQTVPYTVAAADLSTLSSSATLHFTTPGGDDARAVLSLRVMPPQPNLVAVPTAINTGMVRGQQTLVEFAVTNTGTLAATGLKVGVPSAPWLSVSTPALIGDLAPGATTKVILKLTPAVDLPLGLYSGKVGVRGSNAVLAIPASFNCVSSAKGDLTVTAQDEFTYFADGHPGVAGATVTLTDAQTGAVVLTGTTDSTGVFTAKNVTQASYNITVSAPKHGTYRNGLKLVPGMNNQVPAFLPLHLVTYTFDVVPVDTPERYQITLTATFETHVPAPVVTIDPVIVNLNTVPFDAGGKAVVNYTITNHGLIAADNTTLQFPADPNFLITPALTNIGTLGPDTTVVVPVTITRKAGASAVSPRDPPGLVCGRVRGSVHWEFICGGVREDQGNVDIDYGTCVNPANNGAGGQTVIDYTSDPGTPIFPLPIGPIVPDPFDFPPSFSIPQVIQDQPCQLNLTSHARTVPVKTGTVKTAPVRTGTVKAAPVRTATVRPAAARPADTPAPQGTCARIQLQLDQSVAITRTAFKATLDLMNSPDNVDLKNVQVSLNVQDAANNDATALFGISAPTLSGVDAVDGTGTVPSGGDGNVQWTLLPTHAAAPDAPTQYFVGGTISYTQDGTQVTIPLFPTPILVKPDPLLQFHYFLQKTFYGPDPFDPASLAEALPEPFSLGLLVVNAGAGTAHHMTITAAQPQIVDNEKGLLIDFKLLGAQVNTQPITPAFEVNLGDVAGGETATARWLLTASLAGQFLSFDAAFKDVNDLGNARTSLIDSVDTHLLEHVVRVDSPTDDGKPDFLTIETPNATDLPDTVWLSQGGTAAVARVTNASVDGPPSGPQSTVTLTLPTTPSGFVYVRLDDPAPGQFPLRVVRSDGRALRLGDNVWTTSRVIRLKGQAPFVQNRLYLFDTDTTGSYTLYYASSGGTGGNAAPVPPAIGALAPNAAVAGSAALTLAVGGTGFVPGSVVTWNGSSRATTYVSATRLQAAITRDDLADVGTAAVAVVNPDAMGGASGPAEFNIGAPVAAGPPPSVGTLPVEISDISGVTRGGGTLMLTVAITNGSAAAATHVTLAGATLGKAAATTGLPVSVGDLAPGQTRTVTLTFPDSAGAAGAAPFLTVKGTYDGGKFTSSRRTPPLP